MLYTDVWPMYVRANLIACIAWVALICVSSVAVDALCFEPSDSSECLIYDAYYAGLRIGQIELVENRNQRFRGKIVTRIDCHLKASAILSLERHYYTVLSQDYSEVYIISEANPQDLRETLQFITYTDDNIVIDAARIVGSDTSWNRIHIPRAGKSYLGGLSIIHKLRFDDLFSDSMVHLPIYIGDRWDSVHIESAQITTCSDPAGNPVQATTIKGTLPEALLPGLGHRFEISISRDEERIPLKAKVQMAVGWVELLLRPNER